MLSRLLLAFTGATMALAQAPLAANVGNFIHDVSDLDRSVRFYHDILGMDMPRPAGDWQTTDAILKMYDAEGARFRVAMTQIPGSPMRVEMVEFEGVEQKPVHNRSFGAVLMLTVADLDPVEQRLKSARLLDAEAESCGGRGLLAKDPDGFRVIVVEHKSSDAAPKSNFTGLRFGYIEEAGALEKGPFAALGLAAQPLPSGCTPVEQVLLDHDPISVINIPGGFEVWLFRSAGGGNSVSKSGANSPQTPVRPRDPGAAVLRLMVTDVDKAVEALGQAQVKIVSAGGAVQTLTPGGVHAAILGAPDGLLIQVVK